MTKYQTTTEEVDILVLEARIDALLQLKYALAEHKHDFVNMVIDLHIANLSTQLQALKQKAKVS